MIATNLLAQGIKFETGSWADVQAKAKAQNKPIFVDAYTSWCGPCKQMAKEVFTQNEVGEYFNKNYVSYKLDMEKGEGVEFGGKYQVAAYPTMLYFSPDGKLVHRTLGSSTGDVLVQNAVDALDPAKQFYTQEDIFKKGSKDKDADFLLGFCMMALNASDMTNAEAAFGKLWKLKTKEELVSNEMFELVMMLTQSYKSDAFRFVIDNRKAYEAQINAVNIEQYIHAVYDMSVDNAAQAEGATPQKDLKPLLADAQKNAPTRVKYLEARFNYIHHTSKDATSADAAKYKKIYFDKYSTDWTELNAAAWEVYELLDATPAQLKQAIAWADRSISFDKNYFNTDTRAWLLYRMGRKDEARKAAEVAIQLARETNMDYSATKELLDLTK